MCNKKQTHHYLIYKFFSLLLIFLIINNILSEFPKKNLNLSKRLLNEVQKKQNSINDTTSSNTTLFNTTIQPKKSSGEGPLTFLLAFYILFLFLAIYLRYIIKKSKYEQVNKLLSDFYKFLYIANNGALFVTLINIVVVYENLGIASIIIGIIIFILGGAYYFRKFKSKPELVEECFRRETLNKLLGIPRMILKLVCSTLYCCLCESSLIIRETYIDAFGNKEVRESESCLPYIWNYFFIFFKMVITIFTIIAYYIGLALFCLFWFIAKLIYNKYFKKKQVHIIDNPNPGNNNNNNNPQNELSPNSNPDNNHISINNNQELNSECRINKPVEDGNNEMPTMDPIQTTENLRENSINNNGEKELDVKINNEIIQTHNINQEGKNYPNEK